MQPYLDKLYRWGRKWGLEFLADKSALVMFSRSHSTPTAPLLFIHGRRILAIEPMKFLGVIFDRKLTWAAHIDEVVYGCIKKRNLFNIITNQRYGPSIHTLTTFYKTIVRSKIDYGIMAYGGACPTTISKIDREIAPLARDIYIEDPSYSNQLKNPVPWSNLPHMTWTFPITKTEATMNQ
ncbi:Pol-like protein [Daphnia magna]|uniref:Pol-like protein n=1 Tax=Daphnia magna TaxID=35525 RepID=A0A164X6D7_9CRUS|nr:Pol-like protein [Daphnia magna]